MFARSLKAVLSKIMVLAVSFCVCTSSATVGLTESPIQDQGVSGFCAFYSMIAYLEQRHYKVYGEYLNLSEEYLALIHLAYQIMRGVDDVDTGVDSP
ncbi:MAG TPA: hypothetical protein VN132_11755, partial [Bdellovibrio sp.]|nr:hypothetical protein [Bdellovibrio sp.]